MSLGRSNMKFFILILSVLQICNATKCITEIYSEGIKKFYDQISSWTYPKNSSNYVGDNFNETEIIYDGEFDFIICGASYAGSVIANRLSEISTWKILILEEGEAEDQITVIPKLGSALRTSKYNWGYRTTAQRHGFEAYIDNKLQISQGKAVGGNSAIDFMLYIRGQKQDYDNWGKNNPGWTYADVLPYFKKSENVGFPNADTNYHGTNGELNVEYSKLFDEVGQAFLDANSELGRKNLDYNAESKIGASRVQLIQQNGKRQSGAKAFINVATERPNVQIYSNSLTSKLLINEATKEVYGVQYLRNGTLHYANASKEVILSRDPINTAQTLMLSGIGPYYHLHEHGIKVVQDLQVGKNLRDKLAYSFTSFQINYTYEEPELDKQIEDLLVDGGGSLTAPIGLQAVGFSNVHHGILYGVLDIIDWSNEDPDTPDVEYLFRASTISNETYEFYKNLMGYTKETYDNVVVPSFGLSQWTVDIIPFNLRSRGTVELKSASPLDFPIIDPDYFHDLRDSEIFVDAIKDAIKIAGTKAMQKFNSKLIKVRHPACRLFIWGTDSFWRCMVHTLSTSISEFSGTTKMGPRSDFTTVVDHTLKVHGIKNLRVADCSVVPDSFTGHVNVVTYMIGEKASDLIKETYLNTTSTNL